MLARAVVVLALGAFQESEPVAVSEYLSRTLEEASSLSAQGDLAGARDQLALMVERFSASLEPGHVDLLAAREELALALAELGDWTAAREVLEEVNAAWEQSPTPHHPRKSTAKLNLAATRKELGDLQGALVLEEELLEELRRRLPEDHPELLRTQSNLASTLARLGDFDEALELEEHVHATWERTVSEDHPDLLRAKQSLAITRAEMGDLAGALELEEQVHAIRARTLPADHPDLLMAKMNLAGTLGQLGDLDREIELLEHVHEARERLLPADHIDLLMTKANLGSARGRRGDLSGALELEEEVHASWERLLPPDHFNLLVTKLNLAATRRELGDFTGAQTLLEQVHQAWKRLLPPESPYLLAAKQNLAATRNDLGDHAGALELEEHVLAIRERILPPDHPDLLRARWNLAASRDRVGDLDGARELMEKVYAARERLLPPDHPDLLESKEGLATILFRSNELGAARDLFDQVLAERKRRLSQDNPALIAVEESLAATREAMGDLPGALELLEHVHATREKTLDEDHPNLLRSKQNLAVTRAKLGDMKGAFEMTRSLLAGQLVRVEGLYRESPRVARAAAMRELKRLSDALYLSDVSPADRRTQLDEPLFCVLESLRLVSTHSSHVSLATSRSPELAKLGDTVANLRGRLNDLVLSPPSETTELAGWRNRLVDLADERDRVERDLRTHLAESGVITDAPTSARIEEGIEQGAALVSYFRYARHYDGERVEGAAPDPVPYLLAFVMKPGASLQRIDLGPAGPIEAYLSSWRAQLSQPLDERGIGAPGTSGGAPPDVQAGDGLREMVLDPILALVPEALVLHVVADDFLHLVPLDALPLGEGLVGERVAIRNEPTVLRLLRGTPPTESAPNLVVLGGVDFDAQTQRIATRTDPGATPSANRVGAVVDIRFGAPEDGFVTLAGAAEEMEAVVELFRQRFEVEPTILAGDGASKAALHERAPEARFLHLATHGWFAPERFRSMVDSLDESEDSVLLALSRAEDTIRGFAPETLCGLALAGANRGRNELGKVPGILTAEELATLDLSNCELAVLSACETNVGIRRAGQGIQSLQTALHAAGARTAITSLWKVDDFWTRELMTEFYRLIWVEERPKAEALWEAKMRIRERGADLVDWAGWVLTGDPE